MLSARGMAVEQVDRRRADEARDEQRCRPLVEILGRALLLDPARVHDDDAVGHRRRLDLIVGHEDRRHAELALDAPDLGAHRQPERRVEIGQRLVEQQQMRPLDQRAGERHALLLAARELRWAAGRASASMRTSAAISRGARLRLGAFDLLEAQREHDVLEHGHVRIERVGLEDDADVAVARLDVVDARAVEARSRRAVGL